MKINPINNSRYPIFTILKETVSTLGTKLKTLVSDVFQREEKPFSKYAPRIV